MNSNPFYLFLRYASASMDMSGQKATQSSNAPRADNENDPFTDAMQMLNSDKLMDLIGFIDHALSTIHDPKALARIFENGNLYFAWRSDEGPRLALLAIRKAASESRGTAPGSRTPVE